jgi:hypothetical protein
MWRIYFNPDPQRFAAGVAGKRTLTANFKPYVLSIGLNRLGTTTNWDTQRKVPFGGQTPLSVPLYTTEWKPKSLHSQLCAFMKTAHHVMWREKFLGINYFIENDLF